MQFLTSEIGSAKENLKSPIHNWYKFTAGFSHRLVTELTAKEQLSQNQESAIFDPFAGCGTTLVSAQKLGIPAYGNEAQEFMFDIIRAKIGWGISIERLNERLKGIDMSRSLEASSFSGKVHDFLHGLYSNENLGELYSLRAWISDLPSVEEQLFFKLALSQTLHKTSIFPISVPYIVRAKQLKHENRAIETFKSTASKMIQDLKNVVKPSLHSQVYLHDSRTQNDKIPTNSCKVCITSPPYLNNLDYGEISKVHTHFFGITSDWKEITSKVRRGLVTGSTTHYNDREFDLDSHLLSDFCIKNPMATETIRLATEKISALARKRAGGKSYHILTWLYFQDMYRVLAEIFRVLQKGAKAYLIVGDSAPYGIHIPTTELLGEIAKSVGFQKTEIHKIRTRGTKWKELQYRHSLQLDENILVLS